MTTASRRADAYVGGKHRWVHGWLSPQSAKIINGIGSIQVEHAERGAVGEIGVHHGKLFILLALSATSEEKTFAIDVFGDQHLNLDQSGHGDKDVFYRNLRKFDLDPGAVTVLHKNSLDVSGDEIINSVGRVRLFSVDGGHTEECIINDMRLADATITPRGVIVIDDVFNGSWPAVVSGYMTYLANGPGTVPFAISPNKVYACRPDQADFYRGHLRANFAAMFDRSDRLAGHDVDTYGAFPRFSLPRRAISKVRRMTGL